jgi:hypothetical protein
MNEPLRAGARLPHSRTGITSGAARSRLIRNTTWRSPAHGRPGGSIAHDVHALTAQETQWSPPNTGLDHG